MTEETVPLMCVFVLIDSSVSPHPAALSPLVSSLWQQRITASSLSLCSCLTHLNLLSATCSEMTNSKPSALLSLIGVMLLWPYVLTKSVSFRLQTAAVTSLSAVSGQGEESHHLVKRTTQNCESTFDSYCLNKGQCMLLVDINEHHCKCESGFYGPRCSHVEFVSRPIGKEQIIVTIFCVTLLIIGLAGALYFCCKWYKKKNFQKQQGYKGVQTT